MSLFRLRKFWVFFLLCVVFFSHAGKQSPVELVYPYLDTANSRWFFFDSASRPFGMVNLSPDTEVGGAWGSGYRYNTEEVKGFSHVHAWQLSGPSVMPVSTSESLATLKNDYFSPFSHDDEDVKPGFHKLALSRYNIEVELTATTRVGFHQYTYPAGKSQQVLFNLGGRLGPSDLGVSEAHLSGKRAIGGYITNLPTYRRTRSAKVYFYAQFNRDIVATDGWRGEHDFPNVSHITGRDAGLLVHFESSDRPLLMKVGISYVSADNAKLNLNTELPHWDFSVAKDAAFEDWNQWLGKIRVDGGSERQRRRFYTDLWHALQGRRIVSDVNGQYLDQTAMESVIRQIPLNADGKPLFNHHNSDSFWGAQWTISTLWPLVYPEVASDFTNSLVQYYKDGGMIARGPSGGNYTYVMTGASATPFIVSSYLKGIRDFDVNTAYEGLKHSHSETGIMARAGYEHYSNVGGGISHYLTKGYIPYPLPETESAYGNHRRGPGQTLEYAFQDHTLAQLAKALNKQDDFQYFTQRSQNYRNVFDASTGYMRPKNPDGTWQTPFDPFQYENGFVESNPAQGTWNVAHDVAGLAELMGGKDVLIERLENDFRQAEKQGFTAGNAHADEAREEYRRSPINYGNQPSIQTAFLFSAAGAPWKSQYWSRRVVEEVYSDLNPERGYNGDEDQGLMGSLAVLMKIGLFQLSAGTETDPIYYIGSPIFDQIQIQLDSQYYSGNTFTIQTLNNSEQNVYVKAIQLNGETLERSYLKHSEITAGGELVLTMSDEPNTRLKK